MGWLFGKPEKEEKKKEKKSVFDFYSSAKTMLRITERTITAGKRP